MTQDSDGYGQRKLCVQFTYTGRTGDVDLCEIVADDVDAHEQQTPSLELRAHALGNGQHLGSDRDLQVQPGDHGHRPEPLEEIVGDVLHDAHRATTSIVEDGGSPGLLLESPHGGCGLFRLRPSVSSNSDRARFPCVWP